MWHHLTPSEQARLLGMTLASLGMVALAAALAYVAYQIGSFRQQVPELLAQVEQTSQKVGPVLHEIGAIRELIPPILAEVKASRELVPPVVAEARALREALPPLVATSATSLDRASSAVRAVEPHIPKVLSEVRQTREALPVILERADQVVTRASKVGRQAGQGAAEGILGGIIAVPFRMIGDVGKGLSGALGLGSRREFTTDDEGLAINATNAVIKNGRVGAQRSWKNATSKNRGTVSVIDRMVRDNRPCMMLRHRVEFASGDTHETDIVMCQQPDGAWIETAR